MPIASLRGASFQGGDIITRERAGVEAVAVTDEYEGVECFKASNTQQMSRHLIAANDSTYSACSQSHRPFNTTSKCRGARKKLRGQSRTSMNIMKFIEI